MEQRRPIAARNTQWAAKLAAMLAGREWTPNGISKLSIACSLMAASMMLTIHFLSPGWPWRLVLSLGAAVGIQLRLICNLLDGLVAVEHGRKTPDGGFWNEFPDRVSDISVLAAFGVWIGQAELGWACCALAVLTAYLRELGGNLGVKGLFQGPMAKQQRMAFLTAWCVLDPVIFIAAPAKLRMVGEGAAWILIVLLIITCWRRYTAILKELRGHV